MGPRPLFTVATIEAEDSEVAGDVGSAIMTLPFSCTAHVVGDAMLLVVVVVVASIEVDEAETDVTPPPMETTLELLATGVAAGLALLAPAPPAPPTPAEPAAIGLVIFM